MRRLASFMLYLFIFVAVTDAFVFTSRVNGLNRVPSLLMKGFTLPQPPSTDKARLALQISGPSVTSALFRAELKKELCFFRGCRAFFKTDPRNIQSDVAELVCEGKTVQMVRFLEWLNALSTDISERKANFQGPSLVSYITKLDWQDFKGDLKPGFSSSEEAPSLDTGSEEDLWTEVFADSGDGSQIEAKSMAGTDESV
jgi:hypothetical protein